MLKNSEQLFQLEMVLQEFLDFSKYKPEKWWNLVPELEVWL